MLLSQSVENVLKHIWALAPDGEWVTTSALAGALNISAASVTNLIKKIAASPFHQAEYQPYRGVRLNEAGTKCALEIIRHHRLIELYLHQALGVPWHEVHKEAESLEHVLSEELESRISAFLGDPQTDPHGSPIPDEKLRFTPHNATLLSDIDFPCTAQICEVKDQDASLLQFLAKNKLTPGSTISIGARQPFTTSVTVHCNGAELTLGDPVQQAIFIHKISRTS